MIILEKHTVIPADEQTLRLLGAALNRYCLALTRSGPEAEDLAQETWVKALGYRKFSITPNPEALLLRIAKNTWIDTTRRKSALGRALEQSQPEAAHPADPGSSAEIGIVFQALIKHLSPLQRSVFLLRDVLGYSANEAAQKLDTSEGAVKAALHRARTALTAVRRELLAHDGPAVSGDADFRALLQALAEAYEQGQLPVMLELLRQEKAAGMTMAVSSGTVHALYTDGGSCYGTSGFSGMNARMRMAA
ncbi:RNA polymerase sigma factor [Paenibacillus sp. PK3_47]|uniref:RNA polymerase sigma factor n=1 Tax=Paenibacillus sp. PK3_47 TaxID=2072642 RepID=UPI00201E0E19|nr:RNA polymerase sigma factor [Paenibacillus sp. PK3_47]UQZ35983.1 RNA polymerase sigma factor [Paenibacillus sp. PK3_47]